MSTQTATLLKKAAQQPAAVPLPSQGKLCVKIAEKWYDLTQWKKQHPGGEHILENLNGQDATDAFYSLHSKEAEQRLHRLGGSIKTPAGCIEPTPSAATLAFRQFRSELIAEGWMQRSWAWEAFYCLSVYILAAAGTYCAMTGAPLMAIVLIGVCMQQAGWIGHDYTHGRGDYVWWSGTFMAPLINGFSRAWWSEKHNTHHVYTNYLGVDTDVANDPILHLFVPAKENDVWFRKFQHIYYPVAYSFLYVSWRVQSLQTAFEQMSYRELVPQAFNYLWLYFLGWKIALPSVILAGFLVAIIVTVTHQSEEMLPNDRSPYSFVQCQFDTTRDVLCPEPVSEWLWGGMQYQLEHHLFPTIPKYYYAALRPRVQAFAAQAGLDYRIDTMWQMWVRNYHTMKKYAGDLVKSD